MRKTSATKRDEAKALLRLCFEAGHAASAKAGKPLQLALFDFEERVLDKLDAVPFNERFPPRKALPDEFVERKQGRK